MGPGPVRATRGKRDWWNRHLTRLQTLVKLDSVFLAAIVRVIQATLGPIIAGVLGTAQYHYLTEVNRSIDVHSFISLIVAAGILWIYGFLVVALEIKAVASKLPKCAQVFLDSYFQLGQSMGDFFGGTALVTLGVRSVRAIYSPACGGPFASDYCYSIPDLCRMRAMGNIKLGGFHCPLAHLQCGCVLTLVTACLSFVSSYLNLIIFLEQRRQAASKSSRSLDEEGLTTSLVGRDFTYKLEMGSVGETSDAELHLGLDAPHEEAKQPLEDQAEHFM